MLITIIGSRRGLNNDFEKLRTEQKISAHTVFVYYYKKKKN